MLTKHGMVRHVGRTGYRILHLTTTPISLHIKGKNQKEKVYVIILLFATLCFRLPPSVAGARRLRCTDSPFR